MSRGRTGSLEKFRDRTGREYLRARITLADKSRPYLDVPHGMDEIRARAWAEELQAKEDRDQTIYRAKVEAQRKAEIAARPASGGETVAEWSVRWLAWREERGLRSVKDDRGRLTKHVLPELGAIPMTAVQRDDLEKLVESIDTKVRMSPATGREKFAAKTAANVWGLVSRMFADAATAKRRDLRVRTDNPAEGVPGPEAGVRKVKQYLWPAEFLALVGCDDVPLVWRRMFAIAVYSYARAGEINALTWDDVDLDRGILNIHSAADRDTGTRRRTKTNEARRVPVEAELYPLLAALKREEAPRPSPVTATDRKLSRQLKRCLALAGVTRAELFTTDATRKAIAFHDLRATGLTWMAVRGDDPLRIKQRAGHRTFSTTEGYIREAEVVAGAHFGRVFPALPESLLDGIRRTIRRSGRWTMQDTGIKDEKVEAPGIEPEVSDVSAAFPQASRTSGAASPANDTRKTRSAESHSPTNRRPGMPASVRIEWDVGRSVQVDVSDAEDVEEVAQRLAAGIRRSAPVEVVPERRGVRIRSRGAA